MAELDTALTDRRRRRRRRGLVVLLLTLAIASLGAGAFSLALFTDSDATTGSFSTGTIDINVSTPALFTVAGIMPGDSGSATLTVTNGGTAQLRYAMDSTSTDTDGKGLRTVLNMAIVEGACPGTGSTLTSGPLWTSLAVHSKFGNTNAGGQLNDRVLNAGQSEALCFAWDLPSGTTSAYQGATTTTTFTFYAEQTANNP